MDMATSGWSEWRIESHGQSLVAGASAMKAPYSTALSSKVLRGGCYELSCRVVRARGCFAIGWHEKSRDGLAFYMNDRGEIKAGSKLALPVHWSEHVDHGLRFGKLVTCEEGVGTMAEVGMDVMPLPPLSLASLGPGRIVTVFKGEQNCVVELQGQARLEVPIGQYGEYHLCQYIRLRRRKYYMNQKSKATTLTRPPNNEIALLEQDSLVCRKRRCWFQYKVQGKWKKERSAAGELLPVMAYGGSRMSEVLAERDLIEEALLKAKSELFTLLDEQERVELASRCVYVSLASDQVLFEQGESPEADDSMYVVVSGSLKVTIWLSLEASIDVASLGPADAGRRRRAGGSGEMTLLFGNPRTATITATRRCELAKVSRDAITPLLQKREDILERLSEIVKSRELKNKESVRLHRASNSNKST
ncbi:hypothetical protein GUITHDRAFT_112259 [Guillardia theta CCMP2712]|uniref:Cyclic nucleotide-binding domain-containing protein n=1 Tax=Guillardia theta (strain CCMP2712) TaxID=905079 RepID=L1IZM7_GUITC|nr:hypothetical protein GUITHDRAFT_112259 [Guillardia theta CCMP2712]EKX41547.1 hypothetical protein GUITHDRAFT_112259 [Guillardia theta CCMP2712]|eukprot:XP_005828527.1 hypothetical protein GUITHDRAFT_112259 [Guillardia theta CCMP2712]